MTYTLTNLHEQLLAEILQVQRVICNEFDWLMEEGDEEGGYTLKRNIDEQRRETANLKYYLRVHGVQDEGYHDITRYYRRQDRQLQRLLSLQRDTKRQTAIITQRISILRKALANLSGAKFTTQARYEA